MEKRIINAVEYLYPSKDLACVKKIIENIEEYSKDKQDRTIWEDTTIKDLNSGFTILITEDYDSPQFCNIYMKLNGFTLDYQGIGRRYTGESKEEKDSFYKKFEENPDKYLFKFDDHEECFFDDMSKDEILEEVFLFPFLDWEIDWGESFK